MKANLKLVVNTREVSGLEAKVVNKKTEVRIRDLVPSRHQVSEVTVRQKTSRMWLSAVVLAHIFGMVWIVNAQTTPPALKPSLPPMMVSLISSPAPEPEVVPLVPTPPQPQPVIKKQKPIVKEKPVMPEPVASEPVAEPVAVSEAPPTPATPTVEAKAPVVTEVAQAKPEPEPVIEPPRYGAAYLHNPSPEYPPLSRRLGEEGRVFIKVLVSIDGTAEDVQITKSSGFERLDRAAVNAVKQWRFIPAKKDNQPLSGYANLIMPFTITN